MKIKSFHLPFGVQVFKAFSDEARVRILHLLYVQGELCITDIEQVLEFTQSKTSRHLSYLKAAGLTSSKRQDAYVLHRLNNGVLQMVQQLFKFMANDPQLEADLQSFKVLYSNRELVISRMKLAQQLGGGLGMD